MKKASGESAIYLSNCYTKKVQWQILEITKWEEGTLKSERFVAGDCEWIIVAKLKNVCGEDYLSLFLRCCTDKGARDYGCRDIFADYSFIVVNRLWGAESLIEGGKRHFRVGGKGWGFKSLIRLGDLLKPLKGFLVNDDILIRAHVSTVKQESTWLSDLDDRTQEEYTPGTHHQAGAAAIAAAADSDTTEETDIGSEAPLIRAHVSKGHALLQEESTWLSDFEDRTQEEDTPRTRHQAGAAAAADFDTTEETDINSEASADHQEEEEEASDSDTSEETEMNFDAPADHQEEEEEASDSDTSEETDMNSDAPADHQEEEE
ncbi:unnamed protein product [Linum trigynum]|uniref:MATH domain-containing protein n=1 Tax=Linum trigynum TaxID=586398 RepID=A0AAV2GT81_9ROSI